MKRWLMFPILAVLVFAFGVRAYDTPNNWKGFNDTASIVVDTTDSTGVSRAFVLTDGEDVRALMKFNDTSATGFANDSVRVQWGYQHGTITLNSSGKRDTLWAKYNKIVLDSLNDDSLGVGTYGVTAPAGTVTRTWTRASDTSSISGWAVQERWFVPEWSELIRFWTKALGKNGSNGTVVMKVELHQRKYVPSGK